MTPGHRLPLKDAGRIHSSILVSASAARFASGLDFLSTLTGAVNCKAPLLPHSQLSFGYGNKATFVPSSCPFASTASSPTIA
eukprot:206390-Pyramimonas_sp.AAC.1